LLLYHYPKEGWASTPRPNSESVNTSSGFPTPGALMLFKTTPFILSLFFFIYILTPSLPAQLISSEIYETEEDLQEGLELGLLTFDQYLELLDMIQSKVIPTSEETDKLEFVPDVSNADVSQIGEKNEDINLDQKTSSFLKESEGKSLSPFSGRIVWRFNEEFHEEGGTENFLLGEMKTGNRMIWHIEADKETNSSEATLSKGDLRFRKRFVKFLLPRYNTKATIGNFDKRIGLGLNVGYHPLFGYTSGSDMKSADSFLYPVFGRYNGALGESEFKSFSIMVFYSKTKREKIEDQISAFDLSFVNRHVRIGMCVTEGKLRNIENKNAFNDDCQSLHFDLKLKSIKFSTEYALLANQKSGLAFDLYSLKKRYSFDFSGWRYDDNFVHPHGGGISHPDYESFYLEEVEYTYRSRQAGERGIFFKSRYNLLDRLILNFAYNQWRERSYQPDKIRMRVGTGYEFSKRFSFMIYQLWSDYDVEDERVNEKVSSVDLFFSPLTTTDFSFIANYRNSTNKDYGDIRLKMRTHLLSSFNFVLWVKYNDPNFSRSADEYFSFHVQEKIRFLENYFVSAEYISKFYQDESKVDSKAVRIRLEALW
jgi:hypothetical protein